MRRHDRARPCRWKIRRSQSERFVLAMYDGGPSMAHRAARFFMQSGAQKEQ